MLFKISLHLAKFAGVTIFELRKIDAEEVFYLFRHLNDFSDSSGSEPIDPTANVQIVNGVRRVQKFADQVDWFD